ncbi:ATP-binding cassette domain-containing protein [Azospirillum sp. SYSU D00513]|uniref:ABC transporter ATP-binding protein n=1 Tax=Azospirillum sp. SYSU D00513 TaxID=2812561 RepID=UPI001A96E15C|nr:ATP-binding cassette domain-containing protein [Azospirillum sp. SYSU D00513]
MFIHVREKLYDGPTPRVAIRGLRLELAKGEFVALVGPSGCGKTTLLNILAGLDRDFDGERRVPEARLGMVFQNPRLLPWRTVLENVVLAQPPGGGAEARARAELAAVGLDDALNAYPEHLSVGMQRRVAIARAFSIEPELLLMDEPFVSLDEPTAQRLRALLRALLERRRITTLFVTHDLREAIQLADRIVFLSASPSSVVAEVPVGMVQRDDASVEAFRLELKERLGGVVEFG